jgi:protease-4
VLGGSGDVGLGDEVVDAGIMRETIREIAADDSIVGVVLRVDSPGGSALASDLIWRELRLLDRKKPVIASFSDVAASGGYYIGAGARRIMAEPGSMTGSIGVFGGKMVLTGLFEKVGLNVAVFQAGKGGGLYSAFEPLGAAGRAKFQTLIDDTYNLFLERVAGTRPNMSEEDVHQVAQGRVWTGRQAHERGLVDELGDLQQAIRRVKTEAGMDADARVGVVRLPRSRNFIQTIMKGGQVSSEQRLIQALPQAVREMKFLTTYLRSVLALQQEAAVCLMPAAVRVR